MALKLNISRTGKHVLATDEGECTLEFLIPKQDEKIISPGEQNSEIVKRVLKGVEGLELSDESGSPISQDAIIETIATEPAFSAAIVMAFTSFLQKTISGQTFGGLRVTSQESTEKAA